VDSRQIDSIRRATREHNRRHGDDPLIRSSRFNPNRLPAAWRSNAPARRTGAIHGQLTFDVAIGRRGVTVSDICRVLLPLP
jgi:hypothetical protein